MNYKKISLEKGMYGIPGKSFTDILEELDPSENYIGTPLESLDAFQRQLKRFDIKVAGAGSDKIEKFFSSVESAALFPEYVARAVKMGIENQNKLSDIVATVTKIDSLDYRSVESTMSEDDLALKNVNEGAAIPETNISTSSNLVTLRKRGRMLTASYEALRFQKIDLFTAVLKQIGAHIAYTQMNDAVNVLLEGDGNGNPIEEITLTSDPTYSDIITLWGKLVPYNLNTILAGTEAVKKLMQMDEFKDSVAGMNFHSTGKHCTPLGANIVHIPSMTNGCIIGLDKTCALEMVQAGDVVTEYDKLIDRQIERATISTISGFAKIFTGASKAIKY